MKVIFLDIDGVLCLAPEYMEFSHECLLNLRHILDETNAFVVLSSTWRLYPAHLAQAKEWLADENIEIWEYTPNLRCTDRQWEIRRFLDEHPKITKCAILDDCGDAMIDEDPSSFFMTDPFLGLTKGIADQVVAHLKS